MGRRIDRTWAFVKRRKWLLLALVGVGALLITPIIVVTRTWLIVHTDQRPSDTSGTLQLEEQTESFTCGVHALSTVYKAYGLDPAAERIRWRLGVDTKAVFWLSDSTGALPPDVYMVLVQDYFVVRALDPGSGVAWSTLRDHLDDDHLAVLLIRRRENDALHWVVASRCLGENVEVYDSLFDEPYVETADFMTDQVVSALLVQPTADDRMAMSYIAAHRAGSAEASAAVKRIAELQKKTPR